MNQKFYILSFFFILLELSFDVFSINNDILFEKTPAFPGAEGGGMYTSGGRGGKVLYVTKLTDDGSEGTLRWAINQKYPRTILFQTSGIIELKSKLNIMSGNITIAGQSAPGDGICLRNYSLAIRADNVIIRYLRFRMGDEHKVNDDAIGGVRQSNIIIDHCSMSWSTDECASFYGNINFTMQWCLISESLKNSIHQKGSHGYGGIWGGNNASFHHNLLSSHDSRNPRLDHPFLYNEDYPESEYRGNVDLRNNVIYNWGSNNCYGGEGGKFNFINNYYKPGPATSKKTTYFIQTYGLCKDIKGDGEIHDFGHPALYIKGNFFEGNPNNINKQNEKGVIPSNQGGKKGEFLQQPLPINGKTSDHTTTQTAVVAFKKVLEFSGASLHRDKIDLRVINDVKKGTATINDGGNGSSNGLIDTQNAVGGWPIYVSLTAPNDSDGDGMPDSWEDKNDLDKNNPKDGTNYSINNLKYTNLEIYLNSLVDKITKKQNELN
ncbi:MAG: pectate lyase [Paludibacter sp.]|nr:pectate lyase [Paludibacter sp.]